jgi:hypothetical protein
LGSHLWRRLPYFAYQQDCLGRSSSAKRVFSMAHSNLTDAELWEAMAANNEEIAQIAKYQLAVAKGRIDPTMQAKLIASDMKASAKLQRQHDAYYAELQRRHSRKGPRRKTKRG